MPTSSEVELAKPAPAPPLVAMPTSSAEHSTGELDRHQPPPLTAASVVKRKRTKRPRHHPPAASSPASSSESTTTEEEDMAHCLILLAQGAGAASGAHAAVDSKPSPSPSPALETQPPAPAPAATTPLPAVRSERYTSRKYTEAATTADGVKAGFYVYECKTCNKCFPTFQALGGHRASHKKPRLAGADDEIASNVTTAGAIKQQQPKPPAPTASGAAAAAPPLLLRPQIDVAVFPDVTTALSLNSGVAMSGGTAKLRVHECSICGAEFASGQALGGHMRRHRPLNAPERAVAAIAAAGDTKKEGSACINLELDLNLPAPSDEEAVSLAAAAAPAVMLGLGQFSDGKKAGLVLTASALVDCHY